jgi:hypothetical protein
VLLNQRTAERRTFPGSRFGVGVHHVSTHAANAVPLRDGGGGPNGARALEGPGDVAAQSVRCAAALGGARRLREVAGRRSAGAPCCVAHGVLEPARR